MRGAVPILLYCEIYPFCGHWCNIAITKYLYLCLVTENACFFSTAGSALTKVDVLGVVRLNISMERWRVSSGRPREGIVTMDGPTAGPPGRYFPWVQSGMGSGGYMSHRGDTTPPPRPLFTRPLIRTSAD